MSEFVHYWTGYGNLCMTPDGRRADAQCSAKIEEVTCQKCKELKDFIDTTSERHRKESQEQIDSFERIGQPLGHY